MHSHNCQELEIAVLDVNNGFEAIEELLNIFDDLFWPLICAAFGLGIVY